MQRSYEEDQYEEDIEKEQELDSNAEELEKEEKNQEEDEIEEAPVHPREPSDEEPEEEQKNEEQKQQLETDNKKAPEKTAPSLREKFAQVQREKYQAIDAANRYLEEIERLKQQNELYSQASMVNHEQLVTERLNKAKQSVIQALEAGDYQAQADAQLEVGMATAELDRLNIWKAQKALEERQAQQAEIYSPQQQAIQESIRNNNVARWASENPWFDSRNEEYDPWLANQVAAYCNEYDNNLRINGYGAYIYSQEYLDKITEFAHYMQNRRRTNGELNMKQPRNSVAPARRGAASGVGQSSGREPELNAVERDLANRMGYSEKEWKKYKKAREQRDREEGRDEFHNGRYGR